MERPSLINKYNSIWWFQVYVTPEEDDTRLTSLAFLSASSVITSQTDGQVGIIDLRTNM